MYKMEMLQETQLCELETGVQNGDAAGDTAV